MSHEKMGLRKRHVGCKGKEHVARNRKYDRKIVKEITSIFLSLCICTQALGIGTGAQLHQPLAIAVIGGFIVALPLLLIVLPSILRMAYKK